MAALAEADRIVTDDGAYYTHCASHAGSLQNSKAKAPLALLEAYDGLERRFVERGLKSCFGVGLRRLLLRCGIREIVRFDDPAVRSAFYDGFRTRFLKAASAAGQDSAAGFPRTRALRKTRSIQNLRRETRSPRACEPIPCRVRRIGLSKVFS